MLKWICVLQSSESLLNPCVTSSLICDVTKGTSRTRWTSESQTQHTQTHKYKFFHDVFGLFDFLETQPDLSISCHFYLYLYLYFKNVPVPCLMHKSIHHSSPAVRVISNKHNCHPGIIFDCDSQIFLKLINKQLSDNRNDWMKPTALPVRHSVMYS